MLTQVILIRHGMSHHKIDGVVGGPHGSRGLTPRGCQQTARLAQRLVAEVQQAPATIYCSVLPRAVETAQILAQAWGSLPVVQHCGLCTWHTPPHADGQL